jgi:hypothetical protein
MSILSHAHSLLPAEQLESADEQDDSLRPALARVVESHGREVKLDCSILSPSRPGIVSDRGTVEGIPVLDVLEDDRGLLHVLAEHRHFEIGEAVVVRLDRDRRDRIEQIHAACVLAIAELKIRGASVKAVEMQARMAWLDLAKPTEDIDLDGMAASKIPLRPLGGRKGHMVVQCRDVSVETVPAPIALSSERIAGAGARLVKEDRRGATLEIALPDAKGQWWL